MVKKEISVLLVDDHPLILRGLTLHLRKKPFIRVVGTAKDGAAAIKKTAKLLPDVIILDLSLPKMNGLEVLKVLCKDTPTVKALIYSMHNNPEYIRESLCSGASGYLLKTSPLKNMLNAIKLIKAGEIFIDPEIPKLSFLNRPFLNRVPNLSKTVGTYGIFPAYQSPSLLSQHCGLTKREQQILKLIVEGSSMRQIAETITISYYTVGTHFKHIYEKLHVHNRSEAVAKTLRENIG